MLGFTVMKDPKQRDGDDGPEGSVECGQFVRALV